jgi:hypothetical protein
MRGPNVKPSRCKDCSTELSGKNHKPHMGRRCRPCYRVKDKIRKGEYRRPESKKGEKGI